MADKTVITPQQRFTVMTKLFEAGFKSEKDLQSINFQNVFRIEGLTVQDMSIISELQQYTKSNKLYSYLGGMFDEQKEQYHNTCVGIEIGTQCTAIGGEAFTDPDYGNTFINATSVTISDTVTRIGNSAFFNCSGLTRCTIGSSVTYIGEWAFFNCSGLTSITVNATTPPVLEADIFDNTNDCPIYVPSGSVDTYKAADGWSNLASRIQAIP